ncbi:DUF1365-domain-containing protein, partial [Aureobasidium melanogenum]
MPRARHPQPLLPNLDRRSYGSLRNGAKDNLHVNYGPDNGYRCSLIGGEESILSARVVHPGVRTWERKDVWRNGDIGGEPRESMLGNEVYENLEASQGDGKFVTQCLGYGGMQDPRPEVVAAMGNTIYRDIAAYKLYFEYCPFGDLRDAILRQREAREPFHEGFIWLTFEALAECAVAMDQSNIVHSDIITSNSKLCIMCPGITESCSMGKSYYPLAILRDSRSDLFPRAFQLADFGSSRIIDEAARRRLAGNDEAMHPYFTPPELTRDSDNFNWAVPGLHITNKTNVWSIGLIICCLMHLQPQLPETVRTTDQPLRPVDRQLRFDILNQREIRKLQHSSADYSAELRKLVRACVKYDPIQRPSPKQLLQAVRQLMNGRLGGFDSYGRVTKIPWNKKDRLRGHLKDIWAVGTGTDIRLAQAVQDELTSRFLKKWHFRRPQYRGNARALQQGEWLPIQTFRDDRGQEQPLGDGGQGVVHLWCCVDVNNRVIDRVIVKNVFPGTEAWALPSMWRDGRIGGEPREAMISNEVYDQLEAANAGDGQFVTRCLGYGNLHDPFRHDADGRIMSYLDPPLGDPDILGGPPRQRNPLSGKPITYRIPSYKLYFEYCPHGDLHTQIMAQREEKRSYRVLKAKTPGGQPRRKLQVIRDVPFHEGFIWRMFEALAKCVVAMERANVLHGDLCPTNIFLGANDSNRFKIWPVPKLSDFGSSRHIDFMTRNRFGTWEEAMQVSFTPPELARPNGRYEVPDAAIVLAIGLYFHGTDALKPPQWILETRFMELKVFAFLILLMIFAGLIAWRGEAEPYKAAPEQIGESSKEQFLPPLLLPGRTTHSRMFPQKHSFSYSYFSVGVPVNFKGRAGSMLSSNLELLPPSQRRKGWFDVNASDYLYRGGEECGLEARLRCYLRGEGVQDEAWSFAYLVTAPKFLGYSFNPVSFWYIYDSSKHLVMMVLEVNNTFGERRLYLLKAEEKATDDSVPDGFEAPAKATKFTNSWAKDFHVSPFNSRKGTYSLTAADPVAALKSGSKVLDNLVVLNSSQAQAKLVARVYSDNDYMDPKAMRSSQTIKTLASWFWVGFLTFPRILTQAYKLYFKRKLHVWFRPEVLASSISRTHTSSEATLEAFFFSYLSFLVDSSPEPLQFKYTPAGGLGPCIILTSKNVTENRVPKQLGLKVLTPAFYTRFVHHGYTSRAFVMESIHPNPDNRTCVLENAENLPLVLSTMESTTPVISDLGTADQYRWRLLQRLRSAPPPGANPDSDTVSSDEASETLPFSDLDCFVQSHFVNDENQGAIGGGMVQDFC